MSIYKDTPITIQKFQLRCSCIMCKQGISVQNISAHYNKCTRPPKNKCLCCNKPTDNLAFCSRSCSARIVNTLRSKKDKPLKITRAEKTLIAFNNGLLSERATLRKYIAITKGYCCSICELSEWNNSKITLIVDHINGDAGNNNPNNLRLLCPNCNSQTSTFAGRNKGFGRKSRGLPLH